MKYLRKPLFVVVSEVVVDISHHIIKRSPVMFSDEFSPPPEYILQRLIQIGISLILYPVGDAIGNLGNAAGDGRKRVAISTKGDGVSYSILKVRTEGHIPVLAQKPQSITQAQGETRIAEPLP